MNRTVSALTVSFLLGTGTQFTTAQSAGGDPGEVQYNEGGTLEGAAGVKYDATTQNLTVKVLNRARFLHVHASSGDGSPSNPWKLTESEWNAMLSSGPQIRVAQGFYEMLSFAPVVLPSGTILSCEPGATFQFPASLTTGAIAMFKVPGNADRVVIRNCEFQPGITVPPTGESGGVAPAYVQVGEAGTATQATITIEDNVFGPGRNRDAGFPQGTQIRVESGTRNSSISRNRFNSSQICVSVRDGHSSIPYVHSGLRINDNTISFDLARNDYWWALTIGTAEVFAVPAAFESLQINGNLFRNSHSPISLAIGGRGLSISNNVANSRDVDVLVSAGSTVGLDIEQATIVGNSCVDGDHTTSANNCMIVLREAQEFVISSNNLHATEAGVSLINASRGVVSGNVVNSRGMNNQQCFSVQNVSRVTFIGNQAIDCGDAGFELIGGSDLAFFNNTFMQTSSGMTDVGIMGSATCTNCVAGHNMTVGESLAGGWSDQPSAFAVSLGNFGTSSPGNATFTLPDSITLSTGTVNTTLAVASSQTASISFALPRDTGGWGQQLITDGTGQMAWTDRILAGDDRPIDTFSDPTLDAGAYLTSDDVSDRNLWTVARKAAGTGGPYVHDWAFSATGVRDGVLEVWHRLYKDRCNLDPSKLASQEIRYSLDGSTPSLVMGNSGFVKTNGVNWSVSTVDLQDQDLSKIRVRASYNPNNSGGGGPTFCEGQVAVISFNESPNTVRFAGQPRRIVLEAHEAGAALSLVPSALGTVNSPAIALTDRQAVPESYSLRKEADELVVRNTAGTAVFAVGETGEAKFGGRGAVRGTGSDEFGVVLWGRGDVGTGHKTGDNVCAGLALACTGTAALGGSPGNCVQEYTTRFYAFCN